MTQLKAWITKLETNPKYGWIVQFVKFGIVGASNTLIALAVYYICIYWLHLHYQLANFFSFIISVTNAYYWNSRYIFSFQDNPANSNFIIRYIKTMIAYGDTFLLSIGLLWIWVEKANINKSIAPIINLFITIPLNYLLIKFWALGNKIKQ